MPSDIPAQRTLCFLVSNEKILLGLKKKGMGTMNYNGFGGQFKAGETAEEATVRELYEEAGVIAKKEGLSKMATIDFYFPARPEWNQTVHIYFAESWEGMPHETDEMKPEWFDRNDLPWHRMWDSDKYWLPAILSGKRINAAFVWKDDNKTVANH